MSDDAHLEEGPDRGRVGRRSLWLSTASIVIALVAMTPILWVLSLSLKTKGEILRPGLVPDRPQPGNFGEAWRQFELGRLLLNSSVVTISSVLLTLVAAMCAAYAFTYLRFRGSETIFGVLMMGVMVPPAALVVPLLIQMRELGMYDSRSGLVAAYVALGLPVATLVFRGFMAGIPNELIEAARLDGCAELKILLVVVAPLAKGAIGTVTILLFLANWNEFILALVLLRDTSSFTLPLGINAQIGQYTSDYHLIAAATIIASLPIFVVYLVLQGQFERGVAEGALKV